MITTSSLLFNSKVTKYESKQNWARLKPKHELKVDKCFGKIWWSGKALGQSWIKTQSRVQPNSFAPGNKF